MANSDLAVQPQEVRAVHHVQDVQHSVHRVIEFNDTLDDLAYYRFGFVYPLCSVEEPKKTVEWSLVPRLLGDSWTTREVKLPKQLQESMTTFFGHLLSSNSQSCIPNAIHDLLQPDADMHLESKIRVQCETLGGRMHYIIVPRSTRQGGELPFHLVMTSAASVIEIVRRQWGSDLVQVARQLLNRGISFNACILGDPKRVLPPMAIPRYPGLGYRPENYKPDVLDYIAYESHRNRFLSSTRGRAAMLVGGIVARLAREVVTYEDVCNGPSDRVFEDGMCLWDGKRSKAYWDDKLTDDEVDLICGVYRVDTGQRDGSRGGRQTTDVSWWPKPSVWEVAGLNIGYWSRDCESWFQRRLADIKSGNADLRAPAKWRHSLKFTKSCRLAAQINERLASQFLLAVSQMPPNAY